MEQLTVILVDDELPSLENLEMKIREFCPDLKIIGKAQKSDEAIGLIRKLHPDVVFLDIEMPRLNGFRMLEELGEKTFEVVFTTAYNQYAIEAVRISAFDYLVKPIPVTELQNTVARLMKARLHPAGIKTDMAALPSHRPQTDKISISTNEGVEYYEITQIIRIESSSNYSKIFFASGKNILVSKVLKDFEEMLSPYRFFRIHHSHLINLDHIKKYVRGDGGYVVMSNDETVDVSRRKREEFLRLMG